MAKIMAPMQVFSVVHPLINVPPYTSFVTDEKYFKDSGVVGMSLGFRARYVGLKVREKGPSVLALLRLNWEYSDLALLPKLGSKVTVTIAEFVTALSANRGSKQRLVGYVRGIGGENQDFRAAIATYMEGSYLSGWDVDLRLVRDRSRWPKGSIFVTRY